MYGKKITIFLGFITFFILMITSGIQMSAQNQGQGAAELIKKSLLEKGVVTTREEFVKILKNKDRYVFTEDEFLALGNEFLKAGKPHMAVAVMDMATDIFMDSIPILGLLAHSYFVAGYEDKSLEIQAKMMAARGKAELADFLEKNKNTLASTAEEVIQRSLEATGGRESWEAVNTMVVVFSIQSTAGNQLRMVRMYKRPFLYRQGLEGSPNFTATDGTTVWSVSNNEWREIASSDHRMVSMDRWLLNYKKFGISYKFMGFDHINGSPVYHLRRIFRDGYVEDLFFSFYTNLMTEIRSDYVQHRPFMKSFHSLWNYREVEGIKIPFVFIRNMGSLEPPHGGVVEEVRINVALNDELFLPPDYKK